MYKVIKVEQTINALIAAIIQYSYKELYKNYKKIYKIGKPALQPLVECVYSYDCSKNTDKDQIKILMVFTSLINDIDEKTCHKIVQTIRNRKCHQSIKRYLTLITKFTLENYFFHNIQGLKVIVSLNVRNFWVPFC